ncbi:MAG: hypothetical protein R3F59_27205 [Myxococcota bacterium]
MRAVYAGVVAALWGAPAWAQEAPAEAAAEASETAGTAGTGTEAAEALVPGEAASVEAEAEASPVEADAAPVEAPVVVQASPVADAVVEDAAVVEPVRAAPLPERLLRFTVALEGGTLANRDPSYDLFAHGDVMGSIGLAAGLRLTDHLSVVGAIHQVRRGAWVTVDLPEAAADCAQRSLVAARRGPRGQRRGAGGRARGAVARPYAAAQALAVRTLVRLDDDPAHDDNASPGGGRGPRPERARCSRSARSCASR